MELPDYWLTRPQADLDQPTRDAFDRLLADASNPSSDCPVLEYDLPSPKWLFLCHAVEHHDIVLHGSGNPNITCFEPRQSSDLNPFGNQKAV